MLAPDGPNCRLPGAQESTAPVAASSCTTALTFTPVGEGWAASKILSQTHATTSAYPTCVTSRKSGYVVCARRVGLTQASGTLHPLSALPSGR